MFADENTFFSSSIGASDFLSSEPRKSLGGLGGPLGSSGFGGNEDVGILPEPFSQDPNASQRGPAPSPGAPQTPDGCVCATIGMIKRAVKARTGGGALQLHGRDLGLVGLCGSASGLDVRASMFKFTLEDTTGRIEVECSNRSAISALKEGGNTPEEGVKTTRLGTALSGGVVTVYGFPCTDDKAEVYIDCFKVNVVSDMREYVELFPLRIMAGSLQSGSAKGPLKTEQSGGPIGVTKTETDDLALEMYEHITDSAQRAVLTHLLAAKGQAVKRQEIPSAISGFSESAVEAALTALEESGEVALTSMWASLAS